MALPSGSAPSILRASQKDDYFTDRLAGSASEVLRLFGNKQWHRYSHLTPFASHLAYFSITTLRNLQTLGEEYTGIVQVDDSYIKIPAKLYQIVCIVLSCCGEQIVKKMLKKVKENVNKNDDLLPKPKKFFLNVLLYTEKSLPIIQEVHQACFFLGASHLSISKRLTDINYVCAIPGRRTRSGSLRPLGIAYCLKAALNVLRLPSFFEGGEKNDGESKVKVSSSGFKACAGCLEANDKPFALPCGHVLCSECSRSSTSCSLCRAPYMQHRAVALQNLALKT